VLPPFSLIPIIIDFGESGRVQFHTFLPTLLSRQQVALAHN
jgi:hypothetical protein